MTREQRKKELKSNIQATISVLLYIYLAIAVLIELLK